MQHSRTVQIWVGFFVAVGLAALFMLAMKVSNISALTSQDGYVLKANFANIGGLKIRSPSVRLRCEFHADSREELIRFCRCALGCLHFPALETHYQLPCLMPPHRGDAQTAVAIVPDRIHDLPKDKAYS